MLRPAESSHCWHGSFLPPFSSPRGLEEQHGGLQLHLAPCRGSSTSSRTGPAAGLAPSRCAACEELHEKPKFGAALLRVPFVSPGRSPPLCYELTGMVRTELVPTWPLLFVVCQQPEKELGVQART